MDKVEHKTFVEGKEVLMVAENYSTKIYQSVENVDIFYVTSCDDIVAIINLANPEMHVREEYKKNNLK